MNYLMGHYICNWGGKTNKFKVKSSHPSKAGAELAKRKAIKRFPTATGNRMPRYEVISERTLTARLNERDRCMTKKRKETAARVGQERKKANADLRKQGIAPTQNFILCPTCRSKSKKLYSEMGGLETRVCRQGHRFEYDKWIADRSFWAGLDLSPDKSGPKMTVSRLKMIAQAPYRKL